MMSGRRRSSSRQTGPTDRNSIRSKARIAPRFPSIPGSSRSRHDRGRVPSQHTTSKIRCPEENATSRRASCLIDKLRDQRKRWFTRGDAARSQMQFCLPSRQRCVVRRSWFEHAGSVAHGRLRLTSGKSADNGRREQWRQRNREQLGACGRLMETNI